MNRSGLIVRCVFTSALVIAACGLSAEPAKIVDITQGGVGYVDVSTGANGVSAQIGRWDTAYPNPPGGPPAPGLEPDGASTLRIVIDVNDGGVVSFGYRFLTYDAGIWDWFDISMITPSGTVKLLDKYGKPGRAYGTYWESAFIAMTQPLDQWKNQRVTFVFSVEQDGWGDQSAARISSFGVRTCKIPPLTPITDEDALKFENGDRVNTDKLTAALKTALGCLQQRVGAAGGTLDVISAYRPSAYQVHLREVWDRWKDLKNSRDPECSVLRALVETEFKNHDLAPDKRPGPPSALHTSGQAFDARWSPESLAIDTLAGTCGLERPYKTNDRRHFQRQ